MDANAATTDAPAIRTPDAAATLRRFYAALLAGDLPTVASLLTPGAVLHVPGSNQLAGDHRGAAGIARFAAASDALAEESRLELLDVLSGDAYVAAYVRVRARRAGATLDNHTVHRARLESGRIAEIWFHNLHQHDVDAFWGDRAQ